MDFFVDRRSLLRMGAAGAVIVGASGLAGCMSSGAGHGNDGGNGTGGGSDTGNNSPTAGGAPGAVFASPKELRSSGGRLELELVAAPAQVPWGSGTRYALAYNGSVPGPTLRVRPGDTISLRLSNELDAPTNLHTHGLHISPDGASDNVLVMIDPGSAHDYEYVIPSDHPSGTFWYHPHHHGNVATQVSGGLCGVIVVEDDLDDQPALADTSERVLVLSDPTIGPDDTVLSVSQMVQMQGREGDVVLVNGQLRPVITAATGTTERWRIVNASASRYYRLSVSLDTMHQIASDHGRLAKPRPVDQLDLAPGQRAEVLVRLDQPGQVVLRSAVVERGMSMHGGSGMGGMGGMGASGRAAGSTIDLLTLAVGGQFKAAPALPTALRATDPVEALPVDRTRAITFGAMGMGAGEFTIDGKTFAVDRVDTTVAIDTIEDWTVTNASMMDHPFHLHVWPFRVVDRSNRTPLDPGWRDTVNVPAGESVTVRVVFRDFTGTAVYHCHILDHEDLGMMGVIRVQ
jgi:FtsP/CotA-like multicopper oxidase with cupredoxin domain